MHNSNTKKPLDNDLAMEIAQSILAELMTFRRIPEQKYLCDKWCQNCSLPHLPKIFSAVKKRQAITLILPAFPGKSPNLEKVLGALPDYAERLALNFLGSLCQQIKIFYPPGIKIILCSDGRVFSDVVGMNESASPLIKVDPLVLIKTDPLNAQGIL